MLRKIKCYSVISRSFLLLYFVFAYDMVVQAQEVRVIDNKGTINTIRNNQVYTSATAPATPLEGDVWFDTGNSTSQIYTGTVWVELEDIDNVTSGNTVPAFPVSGDIWFDTSVAPTSVYIWDGSTWLVVYNNFWSREGNTGTDSTTEFIGTTDAQDFVLRSNNVEKLRLNNAVGQVLINQAPTFNNHPLVIRANGNDVLAFQDAAGTPLWHWNIIGNGLNFVESNIADNRLYLEQGGNIGVNTGDPDATLDIDPTSNNEVPLRLRPNATVPTGTNFGEFHVGGDGLLYAYDATRSKWLSVDRNTMGWGRNSGNTTNEYLRQFNGAQSNLNGWRMIRNGTITSISVQGNANQSYWIRIRKNDGNAPIVSFRVNGEGGHDNTVDVDFDEGDYLQCYLQGNSIDYPQVFIEVAWRQ